MGWIECRLEGAMMAPLRTMLVESWPSMVEESRRGRLPVGGRFLFGNQRPVDDGCRSGLSFWVQWEGERFHWTDKLRLELALSRGLGKSVEVK